MEGNSGWLARTAEWSQLHLVRDELRDRQDEHAPDSGGKNAVAVDTIEALVMKCDPTKVPYLKTLEADGLGTTDVSKIKLIGKQVAEVAKAFAGKQTGICPGPNFDGGIDATEMEAGGSWRDGAEASPDGPGQDQAGPDGAGIDAPGTDATEADVPQQQPG